MNLYAYAGNNPIAYSDPFGLCPNPPCFDVQGDAGFTKTWNGMVSKSPYLRGLVAQAKKSTAPAFHLIQMQGSLLEKGFQRNPPQATPIGGTEFLDASGNNVDRSKPGWQANVATINAYVSMADLASPPLADFAKALGKNPTVSNVAAHEFGHGILAEQGYKSSEAQADAVECKVASQTGGSCKP